MKKVQLVFLLVAALVVSACTKDETGQLAYTVGLDRVGSAHTVTITVGDSGIEVTAEVTQVTELAGVLEDVPVGTYLVSAAAYAEGASQASAEASATVTIAEAEATIVALILGSDTIGSIVASNDTPHVGEVITLKAMMDDGSTPALIWSDDCGGNFHNNVSAEVNWNVDAAGTCNVSVQVASSAVSATTLELDVGLAKGTRVLVAGTGACIGHDNEDYDDGATRVTGDVWEDNGYYIAEKGVNATSVGFDRVYGVALDADGRAIFSDRNGGRIFRTEKDGTLTRLAGAEKPYENGGIASGSATMNTSVYYPADLLVDPATGDVLFVEQWNYQVKRVYVSDNTIATVAGSGWSTSWHSGAASTSSLSAYLNGLAMDTEGNIYVAGTYQWSGNYNKIDKVYASGNTIDTLVRNNIWPWDVEVHDGYVYFTSRWESVVARMTVEGADLEILAGEQDRPGFDGDGRLGKRTLLNGPRSLFVDSKGVVYFSDMGNNRVRIIKSDGTVDTVLEDILAADFVLDSSRNMYVAGFDTCSIHKVIGPF